MTIRPFRRLESVRLWALAGCLLSTGALAQRPPADEVNSEDEVKLGSALHEPPEADDSVASELDAEVPAGSPSNATSSTGSPDYFHEVIGRSGGLRADFAAAQAAEYSREAAIQRERAKAVATKETELTYKYVPRINLTASYTRQSAVNSEDPFAGANHVVTTAPPGPLNPTDPLISVDGNPLNFDPPPNVTYLNAGVVIPLSDYLLQMSAAYSGVDAEKETIRLNEEAARLNAAAKTKLLYYEWVRTRLNGVEAKQALERARAQLQELRDLADAGRARRADVARQQAFVATVTLGLQRSVAQEAVARKSLHVEMTGGEGALPNWEIGENVLVRRKGDQIPRTKIESLYREAIENRRELQALRSTDAALSHHRQVQKVSGYPRLEGFGNLTYANPNRLYVPLEQEWNGSWDVGVRLLFSLNEWGATDAQSERTEAEISEVRVRRSQVEDELRAEIYAAIQSLRQANLACDTTLAAVPAAELAFNDRKELFERGLSTSFELLDAETTLIKSRLDLVDAHVSLRSARVRLDHALGRDKL